MGAKGMMTKKEAQEIAEAADKDWKDKWWCWDAAEWRKEYERLQYEADSLEE